LIAPHSPGAAFEIGNRKSKIQNSEARVAKLADASDLGLLNHRFQNVARRFKSKVVHERNGAFLAMLLQSAAAIFLEKDGLTELQSTQSALGLR
jgi:hypothetical protein